MSLKFVCALLVLACMSYTCEARHTTLLPSHKLDGSSDEDLKKMQRDEYHQHLTHWGHHDHVRAETMIQRSQTKHLGESSDSSVDSSEKLEPRRGSGFISTTTAKWTWSKGELSEAEMEEKTNQIFKGKQ